MKSYGYNLNLYQSNFNPVAKRHLPKIKSLEKGALSGKCKEVEVRSSHQNTSSPHRPPSLTQGLPLAQISQQSSSSWICMPFILASKQGAKVWSDFRRGTGKITKEIEDRPGMGEGPRLTP